MKTYEITYIISPELTIEEAEAKAKELESLIQEKEGVILKSEKPAPKTLSYQIKKFGSGFFTVLEFQTEPEAMVDLKNKIENDNKILRHIILIKNPARRLKERRHRIRPVAEIIVEKAKEAVKEVKEVIEMAKEAILEPAVKEEKKTTVKRAKSEKSKEKAEMEDIDKKLDEILSE